MNFKRVKYQLFYIVKAFKYKRGFSYLYHRYWIAPKILKLNRLLEKPVNNSNLSIHILTCHRDLVMAVWSLASFYRVAEDIGQLYIHNDGTLTEKDKGIFKKFFPSVTVVDTNNWQQDFGPELKKFPSLENFRKNYPDWFLLKKLIDPLFISRANCRLVIDSDLLWFETPQEIKSNLANQAQMSQMMHFKLASPVYFKDGVTLAGELAKFNSGVVLYHYSNLDIPKLASYLQSLDQTNPANQHFVEQAGYSHSLNNLHGLSEDKYIIMGSVKPGVVLRHYTSPRRVWFYIEGVKILKKYYVKNV